MNIKRNRLSFDLFGGKMKAFCSLGSGSKGNASYIASQECQLLVDVGFTCRQIELRLAQHEITIEQLDGILITHEHQDHVRGLEILQKKQSIPIYCNQETAKAIQQHSSLKLPLRIFPMHESFSIKDIEVNPFSIQHDTLDPAAFTFHSEGITLGICTDLGCVTSLVRNSLKECHYLVIESNHDVDMLHASDRPLHYKQRVIGRQGHLSNEQCSQLLQEIAHPHLKKVFLAHLSDECNEPTIAYQQSIKVLKDTSTEVVILSQQCNPLENLSSTPPLVKPIDPCLFS